MLMRSFLLTPFGHYAPLSAPAIIHFNARINVLIPFLSTQALCALARACRHPLLHWQQGGARQLLRPRPMHWHHRMVRLQKGTLFCSWSCDLSCTAHVRECNE